MDEIIIDKKVIKLLKYLAFGVFLLIILFKMFYIVGEEEQAIVTTFGNPSIVSTSGLKIKIPFIQKVQKINTTIQGFPIGYDMESKQFIEDESLMITSDYNFVNVDFYVEFKISDVLKAKYNSAKPVLLLKTLAQSYIRDVIGSRNVDDVITTGKASIENEIKEKLRERLQEEDLGITLVNLSIQDAEPPTESVMAAFKSVETAKQGKETKINEANKYKSEQIPKADAQANEIMAKAEAIKQSRINEANGQVSRFENMYKEYINYPLITKQRMFYEKMEDILPNLKIVIDNGDGNIDKFLPLESLTNFNETKKGE